MKNLKFTRWQTNRPGEQIANCMCLNCKQELTGLIGKLTDVKKNHKCVKPEPAKIRP